VEQHSHQFASVTACILSCGWLFLPALQYLGSYQRVEVQTGGQVSFPAIAILDLTPHYVILLMGTLLCGTMQRLAARRSAVSKNEGCVP